MTHDYCQLGREIEDHALEHKKKETDTKKGEAAFERVQNQLILQVFTKVPK
jgi:hypothetical protein